VRLVSRVLVAVVVAYICKFVKVSIKGGAYITAGVFDPFLPPSVAAAQADVFRKNSDNKLNKIGKSMKIKR